MTPVSDTTQKNRVAVYNILKYMYTLQFYTYQYNNLHRWLSYVWKSVTNIFGKIYREFPHGKQIRWRFNVDSCTMMTAWRQPFACNSKFFCVLQTLNDFNKKCKTSCSYQRTDIVTLVYNNCFVSIWFMKIDSGTCMVVLDLSGLFSVCTHNSSSLFPE